MYIFTNLQGKEEKEGTVGTVGELLRQQDDQGLQRAVEGPRPRC